MPLYEPQSNFLKQVFIGDSLGSFLFLFFKIMGFIKGDTWGLDYSSYDSSYERLL